MIFFKRHNIEFGILQKTNVDSQTWLTEEELNQHEQIKNHNRQVEFMGIRQLRNTLSPNSPMIYSSTGKPNFAKKDNYVSLSHSNQSICMGVSAHPIGVDIEEINERVFRVRSKFTNEFESELYKLESMEDLTILWTIKESMYKLYDIKGLSFKNDLRVIERNGNRHTCIIQTEEGRKKHFLMHEKFNKEILTYNIS